MISFRRRFRHDITSLENPPLKTNTILRNGRSRVYPVPSPEWIFGIRESDLEGAVFYPNPRWSFLPEGGETLVMPRVGRIVRIIFTGNPWTPWDSRRET